MIGALYSRAVIEPPVPIAPSSLRPSTFHTNSYRIPAAARLSSRLNFPALRELHRAFEDVSWDDDIRVMVLTGAGDRAFCTGADLKEQEAECLDKPAAYWKWMGAFIDVHEKLRNIGKVTVARLNGMVVGGGNEMNISCDLAIAADDIIIKQVGSARGSVAAGGRAHRPESLIRTQPLLSPPPDFAVAALFSGPRGSLRRTACIAACGATPHYSPPPEPDGISETSSMQLWIPIVLLFTSAAPSDSEERITALTRTFNNNR